MHNLNSSFLKFLDITAYTQPNNTAPMCSLEATSAIEVSTKIPTKENDRIDRQQVVSTRDSAVNNDVINYVSHDTFEVETISETSTTATKLAELIKNIEANNCAIVLSDDEIALLVILLKKKSLDDLSLEHKITLLAKNQITLAMLPEKIKETDPNKIYQLALNSAIKCITDYSSLLTDKQIIEILQRNYNIYAKQLPEDRVIKLALEYYSTIPELFNKIPNEYKTQEMCNIVCNKNISLLIAVPKHFKTLHLCKLYCQDKNQRELLFTQDLPDDLLHNIVLYELALKQNAQNIFFVSPALVEKNTYLIEICFDFEKQLIKNKKSLDLFIYLYQQYPNLVTLEQFNKAINQTKKINLDDIPVCYLNKKLCLDIIENKLFVEYSTMVNLLNTDIFSKEEWLDLLEKYDQKIGGILISSLISNDNCQALTLQDLDRHTILKICNDEYKQRLFDKLPFEIYKEKKMSEVIAEYQGILMYSYRKLSKYGINIYDNKKTLDIIYSYVIYQGGTFSYDSVMKCQNCDKDEDKAKAKEILFQFYMNHPEHLIKADFSDEFFIELVNHFTKLLSNNSLFSPINIVSCISYKMKTITNKKLFEAIVNNLTIFCAVSFKHFKKLITDRYIPEEIKLAIYDQILNKGFSIKSTKKLYDERHNPLSFKIPDKTCLRVLEACFKAAKKEHPDSRVALALQSLIENNKISSLPLINDCYLNVFQHKPLDICGGRTAKTISSGEDKCLNFKFQRDNETLKELTNETITLDFLNQHPDAKELKESTQSEIPITKFNCHALYKNVAHIINKFDDPVTIFTDNNDREYVNLVCFETSASYSIYAHVIDMSVPDPLKATIKGILKATHDLAGYTSRDILYTNVLPAFHDIRRPWKACHFLCGYQTSSTVGSMKAFLKATGRTDLGITGLRDLGDFFLNLSNAIRSGFASNHSQFSSVWRHILTANTIVEQLLAAILVTARSYSQLPDYHYENPKAIAVMKQFTIGLLNVYRKRYLDTSTKESLADFMQNEAELEAWLDHMVVRLIYMTAKQPTFINGEPQLSGLDNEEKERLVNSYSMHLNLNGELNKKLYPVAVKTLRPYKFPKDFEGNSEDSNDGNIGLGKKNGTFAIPSLITGLMHFTAELIDRKYS